jgi:hypothetical protein
MILYSQRDPRWANHPLGWIKPGTIGQYGCLDTVFAMIATDNGFADNPSVLDELFTSKKIFVKDSTGTFDLLPDNALDLAFPGRFKTTAYPGFQAGLIKAAVPSVDTYVVLFISTASVPTHFVMAYNAAGTYIADPWTGKVRTLAGYDGPTAVHKTILVKKLPMITPKPAPVPVPAPIPLPPPLPPAPAPVPTPPVYKVDYSLQGLLVYLINLYLKLTHQR